jgi:DNA-binding transcriptional ArsR family regulator
MDEDFSRTAALMSDPGRVAMLMALMDGAALPAGRLATIGNVAPQTASTHLARLVAGKLLNVERRGRHRFYRLASGEVANAIEALLAINPLSRQAIAAQSNRDLFYARACYSHLAGRLAVEIVDSLVRQHVLIQRDSSQFAITKHGREWFAQLGITFTETQLKHPRFARCCLDWTERRHHISGILGSMMLNRFRELRWLAAMRGTRALRVTLEGEQSLYRLLQLIRNQPTVPRKRGTAQLLE